MGCKEFPENEKKAIATTSAKKVHLVSCNISGWNGMVKHVTE